MLIMQSCTSACCRAPGLITWLCSDFLHHSCEHLPSWVLRWASGTLAHSTEHLQHQPCPVVPCHGVMVTYGHSFWLSECPISWDCSVANSISRVNLRAFVCEKRLKTMNLYFTLNANQNMIGCVPFTHANMLSHWLLDFYTVTKEQNIVYLHMLGDTACCDYFHQSV